MRKRCGMFVTCLCVLFASFTSVDAQMWEWGLGLGDDGVEKCVGVAVDPLDNVYTVGTFESEILDVNGTILENFGGKDLFIVKQTPDGSVEWTFRLGGEDDETLCGVDVDPEGNIVVAGNFKSEELEFESMCLRNDDPDALTDDVFVAKFAPDGRLIWAIDASGPDNDFANDLAVDSSGSVYVTGVFYLDGDEEIDFGGGGMGGELYGNYFLVKYNSDGRFEWVRTATGNGGEGGRRVAVDDSGNVHVTGNFSTQMSFVGAGDEHDLVEARSGRFVVKYDEQGEVIWTRSFNGNGQNALKGIATNASVMDPSGVYVTGVFENSVTFGEAPEEVTLTSAGGEDVFLVKYEPDGEFAWANRIGGTGDDVGESVMIDNANASLYLTGMFSGKVEFGSEILKTPDLGKDAFIAQYDFHGGPMAAMAISGDSDENCVDLAFDSESNLYAVGEFFVNIQFLGMHPESVIKSYGADDVFVAKLSNFPTD